MMMNIHFQDLFYLKVIFRTTFRIVVLSRPINRGAVLLHYCGSIVSKGLR